MSTRFSLITAQDDAGLLEIYGPEDAARAIESGRVQATTRLTIYHANGEAEQQLASQHELFRRLLKLDQPAPPPPPPAAAPPREPKTAAPAHQSPPPPTTPQSSELDQRPAAYPPAEPATSWTPTSKQRAPGRTLARRSPASPRQTPGTSARHPARSGCPC